MTPPSGPAGAHRLAGRGCVSRRHRAPRSGAGPRRRSASRWLGGTRRTCVLRAPSMPPTRCPRSWQASRTRHNRQPAGYRGTDQDEPPAAPPCGPGCRSRPPPADPVHPMVDHPAHRPRAGRSWSCRNRDLALGLACRRRTAWSTRTHGRQAAPAAAPATSRRRLPGSRSNRLDRGTASNNALRSPARSCSIRQSCYSMSRPPLLTQR